jgi:copper chaperone NosL
LAVVLAACGSADTAGPPEINYGRDICVQCGMIISEEKFASAYTSQDGQDLVFDDIGDLILYARANGEDVDPLNGWVHDFETLEWVDLDRAWFVPTLSVSTPMGHSIVTFSDGARAKRFAAEIGGEAVPWAVIATSSVTDNLVGDHHGDMTTSTNSPGGSNS